MSWNFEMQIFRFVSLIEWRKSDHIGKWSMVNIDQSIFECKLCKLRELSTLCIRLSVHSVVECLLGWDKTCKVITCTRMPCAKESTINDMENVTKKNKNKVHTQTTINYLVISLQAANKFNQCKGLAVWFKQTDELHAYAAAYIYLTDYMCSF